MKMKKRWVSLRERVCGVGQLVAQIICSFSLIVLFSAGRGLHWNVVPSVYTSFTTTRKSISLFLIQSCVHFIRDSSFQDPKACVKLLRGLLELLSCRQHFTLLTKTLGRDFDDVDFVRQMWVYHDQHILKVLRTKTTELLLLTKAFHILMQTHRDRFLITKQTFCGTLNVHQTWLKHHFKCFRISPKATGTRSDIQDLSEKFLLVWTITRN